VEGQPPLALAIVDPVPGGPRLLADRRVGLYFTGGVGVLGAREAFDDPLGWSWRASSGRFIWGTDYRLSLRHRDVSGGSVSNNGISLLGDVQWQPWRGPGLYLEGGACVGGQRTMPGVDNAGIGVFPRVSAGIVLGAGRMPSETLFQVVRPPSAQHRFALRFGYEQWFRTGEGLGAHGVQASIEVLLAP